MKMTHAFVPQHLIDLAEYLKTREFSDENYDLQCIYRTIITPEGLDFARPATLLKQLEMGKWQESAAPW